MGAEAIDWSRQAAWQPDAVSPCAALPTQVNAVATFNVLNQEARSVVGALLPQNAEE